MQWNNKVVLVTGGASGIGRGIVELFAQSGAAVVIFDLDGTRARALAESMQNGRRVLAIEGDVSKEEDVASAMKRTMQQLGRLDVLVNNAGIEVGGTVAQLTTEQWDRQLGVNLKGAFLFSRQAIPQMREHGGAIVNISSVHAFVSYAGCAAYDASKAGLIGLTRSMALDHGQDRIRVNAICPGYIQTPLLDKWLETVPDREGTMQQILSSHPLGRIGTPLDVAQACLFLASDAATFITGTYLVVDGAMTAAGH